jgi:hypothetical protein
MTDMGMGGRGGSNPDDRLIVRFFLHPVQDEAASAEQGRPIYTEKEYIEIRVPGAIDDIITRPVWEQDYQRFPRQYAQFKNQEKQSITGTPLASWPAISAPQVKELEHFNIVTVEQLANLPDTVSNRVMGFYGLKQRAKDFLEASKDSAHLTVLRKELEEKDGKIAMLENLTKDLAKRLEALESGGDDEE